MLKEGLYVPTFIMIALLLSAHPHKTLDGLMGHSCSKRLETRKRMKPNLPLWDRAGINYIFGFQTSMPDFTVQLLPLIEPRPGGPHCSFWLWQIHGAINIHPRSWGAKKIIRKGEKKKHKYFLGWLPCF